jgi:hypothetical protein
VIMVRAANWPALAQLPALGWLFFIEIRRLSPRRQSARRLIHAADGCGGPAIRGTAHPPLSGRAARPFFCISEKE